jgi:hypothetical protein
MELSRVPRELGRGLFLFCKEKAMSIQDNINTYQAALDVAKQKLAEDTAADQAAIAAAQAQLDVESAKLAAVQPHIAMLDQLATVFANAEAGLDTTAQVVADTFKPILETFIANMKNSLLG